jgi:3-hydroxyisobutyrate dehydrogenase-like beta-hydroxyacid dehydrogenase
VNAPDVGPRSLGFIGLGNIGGGVCANLVADGHAVTVYDVDRARVDALVDIGARSAESPGAVAREAQWTILSLPSPEIMEAVASKWLAEAGGSGKVLIDLTTNAPSTVRAVGGRLAEAGAELVEAPVTGGAPGARNRMLVFIVGGEDEAVARVTPLLQSVGRAVFHLGPLGAGNVGKLVNSLQAFTTMVVSLEGLALAAKSGLDLRTVLEMVRTSGGAHSYLERRVEEIGQRGRPTEFSLELAAKDAGLMLEVGREVGMPMPVASAVHQVLTFAKAQGLGGHDISDLVEVAERAAAVEIRLRPPEPAPESPAG